MATPIYGRSRFEQLSALLRAGIINLNQAREAFMADLSPTVNYQEEISCSIVLRVIQSEEISVIVEALIGQHIPAYNHIDQVCVSRGKLHWEDNYVEQKRNFLWTADETKYPNCLCQACCESLNLTRQQRELQVISNLHGIDNDSRQEARRVVQEHDRESSLQARQNAFQRLAQLQTLYTSGRITRTALVQEINEMPEGLVTEMDLPNDGTVIVRANRPYGTTTVSTFTFIPRNEPVRVTVSNPDFYSLERNLIHPRYEAGIHLPQEHLQVQTEVKVQDVTQKREVRLDD